MKKINVGSRNTQLAPWRARKAARPLAAPRRKSRVVDAILRLPLRSCPNRSPQRQASGALLGLGLDGVPGGPHRHLRVGLLTLEVLLPLGLADLELAQPELLIRDRLGNLELIENQRHPGLPPRGLVDRPLVVVGLVRRDLARMARRCTADRILPDAVVVGQRLHVLGGLVLVLAVLEQTGAGRPEDGRTLAAYRLRQRTKLQLRWVWPRSE